MAPTRVQRRWSLAGDEAVGIFVDGCSGWVVADVDRRRSVVPDQGGGRAVTSCAVEVDELLIGVGHGDLGAFRELHDATAHRVFGFARAVVLDATRAEDIAQDAYLDIWRRAPRFIPQASSAIGWILMITHARAVDHIRTSERIRKHDQVATRLSAHGADYDHTVEEVLTSDTTSPCLEAALAALTLLQREAIQLTYWGNLTGPEASRILGISLSAFKARVHGAMVALRAAHLELPEQGAGRMPRG